MSDPFDVREFEAAIGGGGAEEHRPAEPVRAAMSDLYVSTAVFLKAAASTAVTCCLRTVPAHGGSSRSRIAP